MQQFLANGQTHNGIAGVFNALKRRNASGRLVEWTERMIVGLDPDLGAAEQKRKLDALWQRKQRRKDDDVTNRELIAYAMDGLRDEIRVMYDDKGMGLRAIARHLNEEGFRTPSGRGKWNHRMVAREVSRVGQMGQNVVLSGNTKHHERTDGSITAEAAAVANVNAVVSTASLSVH